MTESLEMDKFWVEKGVYAEAEKQYYEGLAKLPNNKGLTSLGSSADMSSPHNSEELQSPKSFVTFKKISISESDSNKENICSDSPETPKSNIKKIKSQKCILSKDESEWITVCPKSEKNARRNKKSKDSNREATPTAVSNKDSSPPPASPKDSVSNVTQAPPVEPHSKSPKKKDEKKEAKEKANKAEKKRSGKKEKQENKEEKPKTTENVEEVAIVESEIVDKQGESTQIVSGQCSLSHEIAKARQHIKNSLECMDSAMASVPSVEVVKRLSTLESTVSELRNMVLKLQVDVNTLTRNIPAAAGAPPVVVCPVKPPFKAQPAAPAPSKEDSDDGVDLFASDSEDDEAANKVREERLAAYAAKKSKKPALIAKSSIILDVKPWDDETDMQEMEKMVRTIATDGLLWGASKFVLLAYGIKKLQITCVVEDDKVSIDWLQEEIEKFEDLVQSVDIAAFNKI